MGYYLFIIFYPIIIIRIDSLEPQLFLAVVTVAVGLVEGLVPVIDPASKGIVVALLEDLAAGACDVLRIRRNVVHRPHTSEVVPDMPCVNELRA